MIFPAEHFGMQYLPPGGSGRPLEQNSYPDVAQMAENHPLFDSHLLFDGLLDLRHGLMGPRRNRWSISSNLGYYLGPEGPYPGSYARRHKNTLKQPDYKVISSRYSGLCRAPFP